MTVSLKPTRRLARLPPRRPSRLAARELLEQVRAIGGDLDGVILRAGLAPNSVQMIEAGRVAQIDREGFARLYAECIWVLDAHECRVEGRVPITKSEVDMLCYCVITCRSLGEVINRTIDFSRMLTPRLSELALEQEQGEARLVMRTLRSARTASGLVSDLTGLAMFYRLFSWLIGEEIRPLRAEFCYAQLLSPDTTTRLLPCSIRFNATENRLIFPASILHRPVVRRYGELQGFLEYFPFDLEEQLSKSAPLSERIRLRFVIALASQTPLPSATDLAREMSLSPATLRRRLADEQTSLRALKNLARQEAAERMLSDGLLSLDQIASALGFNEASSFIRSFSQWTGHPPRRWQAQTSDGV